ncbi:hypothetical protein WJX84_005181 [Apatococcus fuscideae]|uniref:non-specific serine/threonine protein kinase n=1 Tax=Apatococcus fuscideae TaxID=2026836 RepID=A0AAW1SLG9_9CHLO
MLDIRREMGLSLDLEHANIIKCFACWLEPDPEDGPGHQPDSCLNFVTEYFTSGNLRDYRQRHKQVELKAVRKWARQILQGLDYLHQKHPPIIHGDLRCNKIYVNGHSGEIKIGDLGMATLSPHRFSPGVLSDNSVENLDSNQYTKQVDIFAFGLCTLELATRREMDAQNCAIWPQLLALVPDEDARTFIHRCLGPAEGRPTARELMDDPFLGRRVTKTDSNKMLPVNRARSSEQGDFPSAPGSETGEPGALNRSHGGSSQGHEGHPSENHRFTPMRSQSSGLKLASRGASDSGSDAGSCKVGIVRGEDYMFEFSGKIREGKLHFRLNMEASADDEEDQPVEAGRRRTVDFVYDPDEDTPDAIAGEMAENFDLSSTDRDICAAALKEWLAKEAPNSHGD